MNGSLKPVRPGVWRAIFDLGRDENRKRKQKCITLRAPTLKKAQEELRNKLGAVDTGTFVAPRNITLGQWLMEWLPMVKRRVRPATYVKYEGIVRNHLLKAEFTMKPLQQLRPSHLEHYYATCGVSKETLPHHHLVISSALKKAVTEGLVARNVATLVEGKPRRSRQRLSDDAEMNCWSEQEAARFLAVVKKEDAQTAAFFALALDTGARKNELCGLKWSEVKLADGLVTIERQLTGMKTVDGKRQVVFGPTKNGLSRTISINAETVRLLTVHKRHQSEVRMKNRTHYHDHGLVFAKEWAQMGTKNDHLGEPLGFNNLGERMFDPLIRKTDPRVKRITVHGLRHTAATLSLNAGIPVHVVAARLGHSNVNITWNTYSHVLKDMHQDAAAILGKVLHGDNAASASRA